MRIRWLLAFLTLLTVSLAHRPVSAQNNVPEGCDAAGITCDDLFENSGGRFTVSEIKAASDIPIFANPILTFTVTINVINRPDTPTWRLYTLFRRFQLDGYCEIMVVGLANKDNQYIPYYDVTDDLSPDLKLFGFCRDNNLPGTNLEKNRFPDRDFSATITDFQQIQSDSKPNALLSVVRLATAPENPCGIENGLSSLLTQFAVFILYTPDADRPTVWEDFIGKAQNPLYEADVTRAKIYCLLGGVDGGIPTPQPTPTDIPTPTPTTPPPFFSPPTPPPTSTPIPLLDLPAGPLLPIPLEQPNLTVGQVLLAGFLFLVGGVVLAMLWMSLSARRRFLWTVGLAAIAVLIAYFLFRSTLV